MACRHPMDAAREIGKGQKPLIYAHGRRPNPLAVGWEALQIPCGQCRSCRLEKSRVWGARIAHEAAYLEESFGLYSTFITLIYDEKHLPYAGSLVKQQLQDFFKRLRARIYPKRVRYYASGEYGSRCQQHEINDCPHCGPIQRPHYHAIVLGFDFPDKYYVGEREGLRIYESNLLRDLWKFGNHEIGSCTFESAAYVARYVMKKQSGKKAIEHYTRLDPWTNIWSEVDPEFAIMSRGHKCKNCRFVGPVKEKLICSCTGGIGKDWYEKYKSDLYPSSDCPIPGRGTSGAPPPYYDRLYAIENPELMEEIKDDRKQKMLKSLETGPSLESRAMVQDSKIQTLSRKL